MSTMQGLPCKQKGAAYAAPFLCIEAHKEAASLVRAPRDKKGEDEFPYSIAVRGFILKM